MPVQKLKEVFDEEPYLYFLIRNQAIRHQQLDVFLVSILRYPKLYYNNVVVLNNKGRDSRDLIEDMLNALSDEKYITLIRDTPLGVLVSLPRREENYSLDLLKAHFALNIKHSQEDYQEALSWAMKEKCLDAFELFLNEAKKEIPDKKNIGVF